MKRNSKMLAILALSVCLLVGLIACDSAKTNKPHETAGTANTSAETIDEIDSTPMTDIVVNTERETESEKITQMESEIQSDTTAPETSRENEAHVHNWHLNKISKLPNCTDRGEAIYICEICQASKTDSLDTVGHTEAIDVAVAPTCTKTGLTEGSHCSVCGIVLMAQEPVPTSPHEEMYVGMEWVDDQYHEETHFCACWRAIGESSYILHSFDENNQCTECGGTLSADETETETETETN